MGETFPDNPVLSVRHVVKQFPGVKALDNMSFTLQRGEIHGLVGENGAGKSTLIQILGGVFKPEEGTVFLNGKPVSFHSPHDALQQGIGVVFQENSLCPNLSVAENVFAHRQPLRATWCNWIDGKRLHRDTEDLLRLFKLSVSPDAKVGSLSASVQQLIEIIKALSVKPSTLILDEPTSSLTIRGKSLLFENLKHLRNAGMSMIYISHHLPEVFALSDRITVMRDGRHVCTCRAEDISEEALTARMVGRPVRAMYGNSMKPEDKGECFRLEGGGRTGIFSDISFSVGRGEIVGMAGLAGSGRTSIARAIFGAEPLTCGDMYLFGKQIKVGHPAQAITQRIGYLCEDRKAQGLFLEMSVQMNCPVPNLRAFSNRMGFLKDKSITQFARDCLKKFHISAHHVNQKVGTLSGGNQQKVLLAMWLGIQPAFFMVDEPTRGVDVGAKAGIYKLLRQLAEGGAGILLVSSDLPEVLGLSHRIMVIREGRLVETMSAAEATEERVIAHAAAFNQHGDGEQNGRVFRES